jgi:ABC-type Mn2+/Zn2+ transport system ATPase subunit
MSGSCATFEKVTLGYPGRVIVRSLDFSLDPGIFYGMVGPNGSGKTTFVRTLLGIQRPLEGRVHRAKGVRFGYVPQREAVDELYPLTLRHFVMMSRYPLVGPFRFPGASDGERVRDALEELQIGHLENQPFRSLSGGQKQRALIARALAANPDVLILDEPTNGLDLGSEKSIMDYITALHRRGMTVVMVTHLINLVAGAAQRLILLNRGVEIGRAEEILSEDCLGHAYGVPVAVEHSGVRVTVYAR